MPITSRGIPETQKRFEEMSARLRDMSPVMEVAAQDTKLLIDDSFQNSASPDGTPWEPFAEATLRISPRRQGGRLLVDTARLRNSITVPHTARSFSFGTNVAYGGPQQFGASIRVFGRGRTRRLPARPYLPVEGDGRFRLMTSGRAGEHWTQVRVMVAAYIRTGEIT